MNSEWQIDLYNGLNNAKNMQDVIDVALKTVKTWGFDFCGWRSKNPLPLSKKSNFILHNTEDKVYQKEHDDGYDEENAPILRHCSSTMDPLLWKGTTDEPLFLQAPELFEEFYGFGHRAGYAQSIIESKKMYSVFWAHSSNIIASKELSLISPKMEWITTSVISKINQLKYSSNIILSEREKEILRWTGDGKTASDIGRILNLSHSTINFHLRNAMFKLDASNKTSAVVKAVYLNLLC